MVDNISNNKRIAKNTIILYIRMFIVMLMSLFTSRIVLKALGVEDFGLYNVVGGVVGMFIFLRASMEKCTQRFLNVEMAKQGGRVNETFCVSMTIHVLIALLILIFAESIGVWFLNAKVQIPIGREFAANWVYQFSLMALCTTVITVPYSAFIIAYEKMSFFAMISVIDAVLKLGIAFLIMFDNKDRLIMYGLLMACITFVNFLIYQIYCRRKYVETKFHFLFDKKMFKKILSFTSWTFLGQMAIVITNQGNSILVNMFHSVTANAAMSIGVQVNSAVTNLSFNFQTAFNPQITKSYAAGQYDKLKGLVYTTSKLSFFLLSLASLPIIINIDGILNIWLDVVPLNANSFCVFTLCVGIINALSMPLNFCIMASGKIKNCQIMTFFVYISDLFLLYFLFMRGFPPIMAMVVKLFVTVLLLFVRLYYANRQVEGIDFKQYFGVVLIPLLFFLLIIVGISFLILPFANNSFQQLLITVLITILQIFAAYFIGLKRNERKVVNSMVKELIKKNEIKK